MTLELPRSVMPAENARLLRVLGPRSTASVHESTPAGMSDEAAAKSLAKFADKLIAEVLEHLDTMRTPETADAHQELRTLLGADGASALRHLASGVPVSALPPNVGASLEALVELTGERPTLRVRDDTIDFNDAQLRRWQDRLELIREQIPLFTRSVGRIDLRGQHVGTGFMIAAGLVVTNRHVLEVLAVPEPTAVNPSSWALSDPDITIDFKCEDGAMESQKFTIQEVVCSGPTPIRGRIDFKNLDLGILRIAQKSHDDQDAPPPLPFLEGALGTHSHQELLVIGHPARPKYLPEDKNGRARQDVLDLLEKMYGRSYSVKYLSPGLSVTMPGKVSGDPQGWVFDHDAATLRGNSGSCVVRYGPTLGVIGLHFGGQFEVANHAHAMVEVIGPKNLPKSVIDAVTWVKGVGL